MNDTLMQEKMSSNFQKGNIAFQAAESSINKTFITISNNRTLVLAARQARDLADANDEDPVWPVTTQYTMRRNHSDSAIHSQSETTLNSTVRYVGDNLSPAAGCSIVIGRGTSCMAAVVEVVGTGAIAGTTVSRTHIQGTQKIVPSGG